MSPQPTLGQYVVGVEGLALIRLAFTGDATDRTARIAEIRDLLRHLDQETRLRAPVATERDLGTGYQEWSAAYDRPLRLFPIEEPPMRAVIETLPPGTVLDAACGTGRYSIMLAGRGHDVIGVDQSGAMLDIARKKLPSGDFREGDLTALPLPGRSVDAVVCALALVHVPDVASTLREFARVLRPGGRLVISDVHPFLVMLGWQAHFPAQDGGDGEDPQLGFMRLHCHLASEYTGAATAAGLRLRSLAEPPLTESAVVTPGRGRRPRRQPRRLRRPARGVRLGLRAHQLTWRGMSRSCLPGVLHAVPPPRRARSAWLARSCFMNLRKELGSVGEYTSYLCKLL